MFYGWKLTEIGLFGNFMLYGGVIYVMNAFVEPLSAMYGWSRAGLGLSMSVASLCGTLCMPLAIAIATRFGIRRTMTAGALIGGLGLVGMGQVTQLWLFTVLFSIVWSCGQLCGGAVGNMLIGNWFTRFRGRGFGIVNMGTSLSGAILPMLALLLADSLGVRGAYTLLGGIVLGFCPICHLMVRDTPAELHLAVDGDDTASTVQTPRPRHAMSGREFFFDRKFWLTGLTFGLALICSAGVIGQLKPRFVEIGLSSYPAMICMCLTALFAAIGKISWGLLSDRLTPLRSAKLLLAGNVLSMALVLLPPHPLSIGAFVVFYGLCMGGIWTLFPATVAYLYGADRFYSAYKFSSLFALLKASGYALTGFSFSLTGSYDAGYMVMIGLLCVGLACISGVRETDAAEYTLLTSRKQTS